MDILVVDDDPISRHIVGAGLRALGHQVFEAPDGEAAWALLQRRFCPLLITDWQMPDLDGPELIRRIRNAEMPGYIYCVLLTVRDGADDRIAGLESGADDYLAKPIHPDELRVRIGIGARILSLEQELRYRATHDMLTGLLNRPAIQAHVSGELSRAARGGSSLGLALVDLDRFKAVNDRFGHLAGDAALRHLANVLRTTVRPYDWIGRWGGEEFLILLPGTQIESAIAVAERARRKLAETPLQLNPTTTIELTLSGGVVVGHGDVSVDELFSRADAALYAAKRLGRNQICRDDDTLLTEIASDTP